MCHFVGAIGMGFARNLEDCGTASEESNFLSHEMTSQRQHGFPNKSSASRLPGRPKRVSVMKKCSTIRPRGADIGTTSHPLCSLLIGWHSTVQKTLAVRGDP
jgi:hypothetical protein